MTTNTVGISGHDIPAFLQVRPYENTSSQVSAISRPGYVAIRPIEFFGDRSNNRADLHKYSGNRSLVSVN